MLEAVRDRRTPTPTPIVPLRAEISGAVPRTRLDSDVEAYRTRLPEEDAVPLEAALARRAKR